MTREGFVQPLLLPVAQGCEDSMVAAGEVAGGSFVGDGVEGTPSMLLVSGSAWFEVQEAARFFTEAGSSLGR